MKIALTGVCGHQQFPLISYGGIEICVEILASELSKRGIDFFVVVPKRKIRRDYPFEVVETECYASSVVEVPTTVFAAQCAPHIKARKPDIIWSQDFPCIDIFTSLGIPNICTIQMSSDHKYWEMLNIDGLFYRFISETQYKVWVKEGEWEQKKSFWLYAGLPDEEYDFEPNKDNYALWVGGLGWGVGGKGLDLFIALCIANRDIEFLAYGTGNEVIEEWLGKKEKEFKNFHFMGPLLRGERHHEAFKKAKVFVMPTQIYEALGRVNLEALSKGTPVVGSTMGCQPEIIVPGVGICTDTLQGLSEGIKTKFDNRLCFEYSKKFHVKHEVDELLRISEKILSENKL